MTLYLSIIGCFSLMLYFVNIIFNLTTFTNGIVAITILCSVIFEIAVDGGFAAVVHFFPTKWFEIDKKIFAVSSKERKFYEKIKIRKWKDKVVELGGLGGFRKNELKSSTDVGYIKQFIIESNKGVIVHILSCVLGFVILWVFPAECFYSISLPIAIMNVILNIPSTFILRYNTPKLLAGYKRLVRNSNLGEMCDNRKKSEA